MFGCLRVFGCLLIRLLVGEFARLPGWLVGRLCFSVCAQCFGCLIVRLFVRFMCACLFACLFECLTVCVLLCLGVSTIV